MQILESSGLRYIQELPDHKNSKPADKETSYRIPTGKAAWLNLILFNIF